MQWQPIATAPAGEWLLVTWAGNTAGGWVVATKISCLWYQRLTGAGNGGWSPDAFGPLLHPPHFWAQVTAPPEKMVDAA